MKVAVGVHVLRGVVYGALALALFGYGCSGKGCSCIRLPKWLSRSAPAEAVSSDVEMLGDGSEPRVTLRVARWSGLRYRVVMEASGSIAFEGQPSAFGPTVVMTTDHEVIRGSADPIVERRNGVPIKLIEERAVLESVRLRHDLTPPPVLAAWNQALLPFRGTTLRQLVTESAGIAALTSELLGGFAPPPELKKAVDQGLDSQRHFPFRLPSVAVGMGARWRFREQLDVNGVHAVQVADMTLKAVDSNIAIVGLALRQDAPAQEVPHPLVPGAKALLEQFRGDGEGELTVDRLTAIVVRGRLASTSRLTLSGDVGGKHGTATLVSASVIQTGATILADYDAGEDELPMAPDPGSARPAPNPSGAGPH